MKYKIWDKQSSLVTPIGEVLTAEQVKQRYPAAAIEGIEFVICDAPISMGVFMEFEQTKSHYKKLGVPVADTMTAQEVLDAIDYWEENPPVAEPSSEERIAAALEFQNLLALEDEVII